MSEPDLPPSPHSSSIEAAALASDAAATPRRRATDRIDGGDADALARFEREQLAREFADIERASAALRLGEPTLQSWIKPAPVPSVPNSRPLWLLLGVLWLSTAIVTAGAVAAIATLAG